MRVVWEWVRLELDVYERLEHLSDWPSVQKMRRFVRSSRRKAADSLRAGIQCLDELACPPTNFRPGHKVYRL